MIGKVVERESHREDPLAEEIVASLSFMKGQLASDVLLLAMVKLIEQRIPDEHQARVAAGVASALMANFKTKTN
jgi:hypothetical protein